MVLYLAVVACWYRPGAMDPALHTSSTWLVGDVSRYLPAGTFLEGPERQEQVAITSILSSFVVSVVLAAALQWFFRRAWARLR